MKATVNKADSARVFRNIDRMIRATRWGAYHAAEQAGEEYNTVIKSQIGTSGTGTHTPMQGAGKVWEAWPRLSEYWMARKKAHETEFWIETGGIKAAIRTDVLQNTLFIIEVFAGIQRSTDPEAFKRAMRNEFGLGRGPDRPLFRPGADVVSYRVGGGMRKLIKGSATYWLFHKVPMIAARKVYGR